ISSSIACTGAPLGSIDADLLVAPWFEGEGSAAIPEIDAATAGEVSRAIDSKEFTARLYDVFTSGITELSWRTRRVALVGAGDPVAFAGDVARRVATAAGLWARQRRIPRVAFLARRDVSADSLQMTQAIAEGLTLAEFDAGRYKTRDYEALPA